MLWFLCRDSFRTPLFRVRDLARCPELAWLNRFDLVAPAAFAAGMFALGEALEPRFPETGGWRMLVWGYVLPTVVLMHVTFMVNSLSHRVGRRRFATADGSRNNAWLRFSHSAKAGTTTTTAMPQAPASGSTGGRWTSAGWA